MRRIVCFIYSSVVVSSFLFFMSSCGERVDLDVLEEDSFRIEFDAIKAFGDVAGFEDNSTNSSGAVSTRVLSETVSGGGKPQIDATFKIGDVVYMYQFFHETDLSYKQVGVLYATKAGPETVLTGDVDPELAVSFTENSYGDVYPDFKLVFSYKHELVFDYREQTGTLEDIDENYDYAVAELDVRNLVIDHENKVIQLPDKIRFYSSQAIVKFVLYDEKGQPIIPDKLTIDTEENPSTMATDGSADDSNSKIINYLNVLELENGPSQSDIYLGGGVQYGPLVVFPSANNNEVYVSLPGRNLNWWNPHRINYLKTCKFTLTATVGSDTYSYVKEQQYDSYLSYIYEYDYYKKVYFYTDYYYVIEVHMTMDKFSDTSTDASSENRYGGASANENWE